MAIFRSKYFRTALLAGLLFFGLQPKNALYAQDSSAAAAPLRAELRVDTGIYRWPHDQYRYRQRKVLPFAYSRADAVAELLIFPPPAEGSQKGKWRLRPSADFRQIDSLERRGDSLVARLQFENLLKSDFVELRLEHILPAGRRRHYRIALQGYSPTRVQLKPQDDELFLGEEKVIELLSNRPQNLVIDNLWHEEQSIHYRLSREGDRLLLHLLPTQSGPRRLKLALKTVSPQWHKGELSHDLPELEEEFVVKTSRLAFLRISENEVTLFQGSTESIEVQISDHRLLQLEKTYRIERQEEAGGALIAEIFTKSKLSNNQVLADLRVYAYHRKSEGYLYLKDGDNARFLTNFNISPKTEIERIYLQRSGLDWQESNRVYPGENVSLRIEGKGLHKGQFRFLGAELLRDDSLVRNETSAYFNMKVPLDINSGQIEIFNNQRRLSRSLRVEEHRRPQNFNFIELEMGPQRLRMDQVHHTLYYDRTLDDVVITFDPRKIDRPGELHGLQYLTLKVKVNNKEGNLIELYQFDDLVICPGENSPRHDFYRRANCRSAEISLNEYLSRKTHSLPEWASIELEISHQRDKYDGEGQSKRVKIILQRHINFDIDVSFPAGLLILKSGENDISNFGGISLAMIGQLSFYNPNKIAKYRPYKVGAGFVAIDAFNFSENATNRDVGLVLIGSLYPTSSENKLSFPLYIGYGYLLRQDKSFFLIGPGIRVRF